MIGATMPEDDLPTLTTVEIIGLFDQHDIYLKLFDQEIRDDENRIRIFFDENGSGKTTVLRAMFHLMSWGELESHLTALSELPIGSIELTFEKSGSLAFTRDDDDPALCTMTAKRGRTNTSFEFDAGRFDPRKRRRVVIAPTADVAKYRDVAASLCLPPILVADDRTVRADDLTEYASSKRVVVSERSGGSVREVREFPRRVDPSTELAELLEELSREFRRATFGRRRPGGEAVYADVVRRIAEESTKSASGDVEAMRRRARQIRQGLDLPSAYNLTDVDQLDEVIETLDGLRRNSRNKKIIETVLDPFFTNLEAEVERLRPGAARIDRFVSTVNGFLSEKSMRFSLSDGLVVQPTGSGSALEPDQLSSGERHVLLLLGSAMLARNDRTILIDEPELSLGIAWKRKLLSSLLSLTVESGARFIVASHSVEIISPYRDTATRLRSRATGA